MAEFERETVSGARLTLKRSSRRNKQSTLAEEVMQILQWCPVQWGVVDFFKTLFSWRWRDVGGRACAWMFLCAAACVMFFPGVCWGWLASHLRTQNSPHLRKRYRQCAPMHLLDDEEAMSKTSLARNSYSNSLAHA